MSNRICIPLILLAACLLVSTACTPYRTSTHAVSYLQSSEFHPTSISLLPLDDIEVQYNNTLIKFEKPSIDSLISKWNDFLFKRLRVRWPNMPIKLLNPDSIDQNLSKYLISPCKWVRDGIEIQNSDITFHSTTKDTFLTKYLDTARIDNDLLLSFSNASITGTAAPGIKIQKYGDLTLYRTEDSPIISGQYIYSVQCKLFNIEDSSLAACCEIRTSGKNFKYSLQKLADEITYSLGKFIARE